MEHVILWTCIFSITNAVSVTLLGDRNLISGDIFTVRGIVSLLLNFKVILSLSFAVLSRLSFIMINNNLLKIPRLAQSSTTITAFITILSLILVIVTNVIFLKEKISIMQLVGASIMMLGAFLMVR